MKLFRISIFVLLTFLVLAVNRRAGAHSLLTHEQLIDLTWKDSIVPLLMSRYPNLTTADLDRARAYAYGGCTIQDIGYYPFGDQSFSDLTHYVRTGDFVLNLFRNATNANELAFAIGALSHYIADSVGHAEATNRAVPVEFPKLRAKYGPVVSYAEGKHQHVRTEFAFDIDEIAHHRVAPLGYHRHIGLKVPVKQLALAFYQTYGLTEDFSQKRGRRFNVRAYRFAVHTLIPRVAYGLTILHRHHEPAEPNTPDALQVEKESAAIATLYNWSAYRRHAGFGTYAMACLLFVVPKVGPLSIISIKGPTEATEADYMHSVAQSSAALSRTLARFTANAHPATIATHLDLPALPRDAQHPLANRDLDTGNVVLPGGYSLTDSTYANLLHRITQQPAQPIPPGIKRDIQAFYANPDAPITTKKDPSKWAQVQDDLKTLAGMQTSREPEPYPTYGDDAGADQ